MAIKLKKIQLFTVLFISLVLNGFIFADDNISNQTNNTITANNKVQINSNTPKPIVDLGKYGTTYPIDEEDLIEYIKKTLFNMQKNGSLDRIKKEYKDKTIFAINNPKKVNGISDTTKKPNSWLLDPSITVRKNIVDSNGKILYPAGTIVNPLKIQKFTEILLFVDGTKKTQITWAEQWITQQNYHVKMILINGSPIEIMKKWGKPVYFDQGGYLTHHFSITHVPSFVRQEGDFFRVQEIYIH